MKSRPFGEVVLDGNLTYFVSLIRDWNFVASYHIQAALISTAFTTTDANLKFPSFFQLVLNLNCEMHARG